MAIKGLGAVPAPMGSAKFGRSKKVTVTAGGTVVITNSSAQVGCIVRLLSLSGATKVAFGDQFMTNDSGANPGGHVLRSPDESILLNVTGLILGITDSGTAEIVVQPLLIDGYAVYDL